MEFPYGEDGTFLDVAEMQADLRKNGFKGRIDDKIREGLGGGSLEKINPFKKGAISVHDEAARYRCKPPEFFIDVACAYFGRYEQMGYSRALREMEEKDSTIALITEDVNRLEKERRELMAEKSSLKEDVTAAQMERERMVARTDEREKAADIRLQELLAAQNDLRQSLEQANARVVVQDQTLQDRTRQLEQVRSEVQQVTARYQEIAKEVTDAREEVTALRVQRDADQSRLREYQAEATAFKARDHAREDEIRRLNEDLRAAERREVEANQRATSFQIEAERLRGQVESAKTGEKVATKVGK